MTVWLTRPVKNEPIIELFDWKIIKVSDTYHFLGYNRAAGEGRVSSPIKEFYKFGDEIGGSTSTGRLYILKGNSRTNLDADYVLGNWLYMNKLSAEDYINVTEEMIASFKENGH